MRWRSRIDTGVLLLALGVLSCRDTGQWQVDAGERWWPEVLTSYRPSSAIYAPGFDAEPPAGEFLRFSLHAVHATTACAAYDGSSFDDQWFVRVTTSGAAAGEYAVVERLPEGAADNPLAVVELIHSKAGQKNVRIWASSGSISLGKLPEFDAGWVDSIAVELRGRARFADDPIVEAECYSGASKNDASIPSECTCTTALGDSWICSSTLGHSCCRAKGSGSIELEFALSADPCQSMCIFSQRELAVYCSNLR